MGKERPGSICPYRLNDEPGRGENPNGGKAIGHADLRNRHEVMGRVEGNPRHWWPGSKLARDFRIFGGASSEVLMLKALGHTQGPGFGDRGPSVRLRHPKP